MTLTLDPVLNDLFAKQSAKRRSAAKKLRKHADISAGVWVLDALRKEVDDPRTWETQYQMIMALGESCFIEARDFIDQLSYCSFDAKMVYVAIGDALVRLTVANKALTVLSLIERERHPSLIDGALRAMAMLRLIPDENEIAQILEYANRLTCDDGNRFWIIAACPGWPASQIGKFLNDAMMSSRSDFQEAVSLARVGKYKTWRPL